MKKSGIFYSLFVLLVVSCGPKFEQLQSGFEFRSIESMNGKYAEDGDALKVHMTITIEDTVVTDTRDFSPIGRRLAMNSMQPEFKEVIRRIGVGDSAQIRMNLYKYAKLEGQPGDLADSAKTITMSIRVLDIKNEANMIEDMINELTEFEENAIKDYLINNNLEAQRTEEGVYYIISREGDGEHVAVGDTVVSNFTLKLLNDKVLTTTEESVAQEAGVYNSAGRYVPYSFTLEKDRLLEGWLIGVPLLKEGGKGTFFLPSRYGFGTKSAAGVIPPNATLIYDIEVLELR